MKQTFTTIEQVEEHYTPDECKKYPVVFRRRVTEDEATAIDEWLSKHRGGWTKSKIIELIDEGKPKQSGRAKTTPSQRPPTRKDIIVERLKEWYRISKNGSEYTISGGVPVTIRTCTDIIEYGRTGRFTIDRTPHEKLVARNGNYLFVVIKQHGDDFEILLHRLLLASHMIDKTNGVRIKVHPLKIWGEKACVAAGLNVVPGRK